MPLLGLQVVLLGTDSSVGGGVEVKPPSISAHSQIIQTPTYTSAKTVFNPSNEQEGIETFQVILFLSFSFLNDSYNPFQGWRIQVKYREILQYLLQLFLGFQGLYLELCTHSI